MAPRRITIDLAEAERLASQGMTDEQIAAALGISIRTLSRRKVDQANLTEAIKKGRARGIDSVSKALFDKAMGGDTTAQIFWLKTRAGWSEKSVLELETEPPVSEKDIFGEFFKSLPRQLQGIVSDLLFREKQDRFPDEAGLDEVERLWHDIIYRPEDRMYRLVRTPDDPAPALAAVPEPAAQLPAPEAPPSAAKPQAAPVPARQPVERRRPFWYQPPRR